MRAKRWSTFSPRRSYRAAISPCCGPTTWKERWPNTRACTTADVMVLGESPQTDDESFVERMRKRLPTVSIVIA